MLIIAVKSLIIVLLSCVLLSAALKSIKDRVKPREISPYNQIIYIWFLKS